MTITIPMAITIPQINLFLNKWLAIELAPLSRELVQITQGLSLAIMQIVTEINANSDKFLPHLSTPFLLLSQPSRNSHQTVVKTALTRLINSAIRGKCWLSSF
jgi:trehalose-6-phosphate synthase